MQKIYVVISPLEVQGEENESRTLQVGEYLWAEVPSIGDDVLVYLDGLDFKAPLVQFFKSTRLAGD